MKQKQWFTVFLLLLSTLTLTISAMAAPTARDTDGGILEDAESFLDTLESDLMPDKEDGTVTSAPAETPSQSETGDMMSEDGGTSIGLIVGIALAAIALIIVFVILSRNARAD